MVTHNHHHSCFSYTFISYERPYRRRKEHIIKLICSCYRPSLVTAALERESNKMMKKSRYTLREIIFKPSKILVNFGLMKRTVINFQKGHLNTYYEDILALILHTESQPKQSIIITTHIHDIIN